MKSGLKRIEATLDQLHAQSDPLLDPAHAPQDPVSVIDSPQPPLATKPKSSSKSTVQPFPIPKAPPAPDLSAQNSPVQNLPAPNLIASDLPVPDLPAQSSKSKSARSTTKATAKVKKTAARPNKAAATAVQPFPTQKNLEAPVPKAKPPSFSSHRHAVNPNLAIGMLKEVETIVVKWQLELEQTVLEIQALYLEGPIVDGWLESHPYGSPQVMQSFGTATLRHAEIDRLMDYVEEICRVPQTLDGESPRTGYRLCGLDADGQMWSRPCPAQQVPYVSLAIARYQKLRILLAKKQSLENRLTQLIQNLTMLHGIMQEPL